MLNNSRTKVNMIRWWVSNHLLEQDNYKWILKNIIKRYSNNLYQIWDKINQKDSIQRKRRTNKRFLLTVDDRVQKTTKVKKKE